MPKAEVKTVDDYIASQPATAQGPLKTLRRILREALPGAEEVISYPTRGGLPPVPTRSSRQEPNNSVRNGDNPVLDARAHVGGEFRSLRSGKKPGPSRAGLPATDLV